MPGGFLKSFARRARLSFRLPAAARTFTQKAFGASERDSRTTMNYKTKLLTQWAEIAGEWEACRQQTGRPHIEQHLDWLRIEADPLLLVALYEGERLVGGAPFLMRRWRWPCRLGYRAIARFPLRVADLCGETFVAPADEAACEAILKAVADAPIDYNLIFFEGLATDSLLWRVIRESPVVRDRFWVYVPDGAVPRRMIHLNGTFEEYLNQLSRNTRWIMGSRSRKLEKACGGDLLVEQITQRDQVPAFLQQVEQISERSWQGTKLGTIIRATDSLRERLSARADAGWLRCYLLRNAERPLAYIIGWQADGVYYYEDAAFDPAWSNHSPGKVLLYRALENLFAENKPEWFDFGFGDNQYKQVMSNHTFEQANVLLFRKSAYTALALGAHRACKTATAFVRVVLDRLRLREKVRQLLRRS
jgi:CelD/BcsL family acetyltransferase involved in cellulose biosynthesis